MKKLFLTVIAALAAFSANAQIGIIAGLTSSKTNLEAAYADVENITQYHVGATLKIPLGGLFTLQPAVIYNMKGQRLGSITTLSEETINYKTGYVEVPVQLQAGIDLMEFLRPFAFVEPFVGYAITNEVNLGQAAENIQKTWDNVKQRLEYGVSLGLGVELLGNIQISAKYFWNLGEAYGADINIGAISKTVQESVCNGVCASVAFFF